MIYTKSTPVGADEPIQRFQQSIYNRLPSLWSISQNVILALGRAEEQSDKVIFQNGSEYIDCLLDDTYMVKFLFLVRSTEYETKWTYDTDIYFYVNQSVGSPEKIKSDIYNLFKHYEGFKAINSNDIPGFKDQMNMYPWTSFKINIIL